jgi:uncharacterized protein YdaU (DUF1376 family)
MAERWQQWMPFHIDRFRGSPDVQAMHPVARIGYLYLLASAWQTDDCTISDDPLDLASMSGLGDDLWAQYCPRILRKFQCDEIGGRLYNPVLREEWSEAKRIFEARSAAAKKTTETRSPSKKRTVTVPKANGHRMVSARRPVRSADTITGTTTGTETTTEPVSTSTLASTAIAVPASPTAFTIILTSGNTHLVTEEDVGRLEQSFPAVNVRQEFRAMLEWLIAKPHKRSHSVQGAKSRIVNWMSKKQDEGGSKNGGFTNARPERGEKTISSAQRVQETLIRQAMVQPAVGYCGDDEAEPAARRLGTGAHG